MDLQSGLIVGGVTVAVCAVLILISLFGSSGTSYEQAVAEQRRATSELLALAGNNKQAQKKSKKAGKKAKEKKRLEAATGSERESDAPADSGQEEGPHHVEPAETAHHVEFAETALVEPPKQIRKRKDAKVKPILVNKERAVDPASPPTPPSVSNHFEQLHPKDELELMLHKTEKSPEVTEKRESKHAKSGKKAKQTPPAAPAPASEPLAEEPVPKNVVTNEATTENAKEQRKTKKHDKRQVSEDVVDKAAREEPLPVPIPSELSTDKLLKNVAAPPPVAAQPKQKKKKQEQSVLAIVGTDVAGVNVSELVRLVSEAALSRNEIQILTDALLNKQHGVLPQHSEWSEGPNDPVQKLKKQLAEKEKALADEQEAALAVHNKLKELRASLNTERSRANAAVRSAEEAASSSKVEIHTLQTRMQRLLEDNHALAQDKVMLQSKLQADADASAQRAVQLEMQMQQRLNETEATLMQQLGVLQGEANARAHDAAQARSALQHAQAHAADLAHRLQESDRVCIEVEAARTSLAHAEQAASAELRDVSAALQRDRQDADATIRQLKSELKTLREQLIAKEEQLVAKEEQIEREHTNHQQNGLPPQDDSQKKQELSKLEGVVETLRVELAAALASHADEKKQLQQLQLQLQLYRDKNNEAVAKALEAQSRQTAEVLRAACPQVAPAGAADSQWLATFADQLRTVLKAASTSRDDERVRELTGQNAHLQELVDKYKNIIDDTEGVLDKLQHNVTAEEHRWERLLEEKQRELDRLQQTTVTQMQSKIDALQSELDSRGRGTFADMERGLEENNRLLINEKHQALNGPPQVGLEEK